MRSYCAGPPARAVPGAVLGPAHRLAVPGCDAFNAVVQDVCVARRGAGPDRRVRQDVGISNRVRQGVDGGDGDGDGEGVEIGRVLAWDGAVEAYSWGRSVCPALIRRGPGGTNRGGSRCVSFLSVRLNG
jgi:hypothetical protein